MLAATCPHTDLRHLARSQDQSKTNGPRLTLPHQPRLPVIYWFALVFHILLLPQVSLHDVGSPKPQIRKPCVEVQGFLGLRRQRRAVACCKSRVCADVHQSTVETSFRAFQERDSRKPVPWCLPAYCDVCSIAALPQLPSCCSALLLHFYRNTVVHHNGLLLGRAWCLKPCFYWT